MNTEVHIRLAQVLADFANGESDHFVGGATVGEVLAELGTIHPGLGLMLWDDRGDLNAMMAAFLNGVNVKDLGWMQTPVHNGDELMVISALEGG